MLYNLHLYYFGYLYYNIIIPRYTYVRISPRPTALILCIIITVTQVPTMRYTHVRAYNILCVCMYIYNIVYVM